MGHGGFHWEVLEMRDIRQKRRIFKVFFVRIRIYRILGLAGFIHPENPIINGGFSRFICQNQNLQDFRVSRAGFIHPENPIIL
jgi:hypothetical protein